MGAQPRNSDWARRLVGMARTPNLDLALIFPIRDEISARLMAFKADCLFRAGVISDNERQQVRAMMSEVTDDRRAA